MHSRHRDQERSREYESSSNVSPPLQPSDNPQVTLRWGKLAGSRILVDGVWIDRYLGIPYAEPPLGKLRFKLPIPLKSPWNGSYIADKYGPSCWQPFQGNDLKRSGRIQARSEDCLSLNIWSPRNDYYYINSDGNDEKYKEKGEHHHLKPVFVYIHGGALISLSSADENFMEGRLLAAKESLIVVTFNYRLGALGFLFADRPDMPGNMGIYDQIAALQWIHDNVHHFGGDNSRITLAGVSSGSLCSAIIALSGQANHLVSRVIMESGPLTPIWLDTKHEALYRFEAIKKTVDCDFDDANEAIKCLQDAEASALIVAQYLPEVRVAKGYGRYEVFFPTLDSSLLPPTLDQLIESQRWNSNLTILSSIVEDEAHLIRRYGLDMPINSYDDCVQSLRKGAIVMFPDEPERIEDVIKNYLVGHQNSSLRDIRRSCQLVAGDWYITCPQLLTLDKLAPKNTVYSMKFTYYGNQRYRKREDFLGSNYGPRHGVTMFFIFGVPFYRSQYWTDNDRQMSREMMRIWANFVRNGRASWPSYQITLSGTVIAYQKEVNILRDTSAVKISPDRCRCEVWHD
ncbi:acetylcholinesterase-like [Brevipalpus obovatus]|uniref:acetylcholinesterase-like n=1 Tax=Brevipalpus obovatus TaxID=246614 RepID=UPI003D9E2199